MLINGREIASSIEKSLIKNIARLKSSGIVPNLAVVLIGNDPGSLKYVAQKIKTGKNLEITVSLFRFTSSAGPSEIKMLIKKLNADRNIQGIIIQRPVPVGIPDEHLSKLVSPEKDVDGFHPVSLFDPPIALAVIAILKSIHPKFFQRWLIKKNILIIGRGVTAGKPIAKHFEKLNLNFTIAHSQTVNFGSLVTCADILISCVGKSNIVRHQMLKKTAILIGVGLHPEDLKLKPDYNQDKISDRVAYYTPVPGGVGPVNVAMLFKNLVRATGHDW